MFRWRPNVNPIYTYIHTYKYIYTHTHTYIHNTSQIDREFIHHTNYVMVLPGPSLAPLVSPVAPAVNSAVNFFLAPLVGLTRQSPCGRMQERPCVCLREPRSPVPVTKYRNKGLTDVYVYVYIYICKYIYIYMYKHMHIYVGKHGFAPVCASLGRTYLKRNTHKKILAWTRYLHIYVYICM